jgi:hypothetical protein
LSSPKASDVFGVRGNFQFLNYRFGNGGLQN